MKHKIVLAIISLALMLSGSLGCDIIDELDKPEYITVTVDAFANVTIGKWISGQNVVVPWPNTQVQITIVKAGGERVDAVKTTDSYGIQLIDVIIRQIKYSDDITQNVYRQMIKERNQIARAFRSDGEGEKAKWLGKMEKELKTIQSEAERKAKEIKAKADAEALEIRNKAYNRDAEFADYWMAMQQYEKLLPKMRKILTTDFEFFKYLYKKSGR